MPTHGRPQLRLAPPLSGTADGVGFPALRSRRITLSHSSNFRGKFRLAHGFDRRHLLVKLGNGQSPNIIPRADLAPLDEHAVKLAAEKLGGASPDIHAGGYMHRHEVPSFSATPHTELLVDSEKCFRISWRGIFES